MKTIELFCGAGLIGAGFSSVGFEPVYAVDLEKDAIATYNTNMKHKVGVVSDVKKIKKMKADVIIAGPPCQGFSTLGKRDSKDERNKLSLVVFDWAKTVKPKVVVIENVPQFLSSVYYRKLVKKFGELGYESVAWVLDAYDYGTAQYRKRSFTIFSKIGLPATPKTHKRKLTIQDAFKGLACVNARLARGRRKNLLMTYRSNKAPRFFNVTSSR